MACSLSPAAEVYPYAGGCSRRIGGRLPAPAGKAWGNVNVRPAAASGRQAGSQASSPSPMRSNAASSPKKSRSRRRISPARHGWARVGHGQRAASQDHDEEDGSLPAEPAAAGRVTSAGAVHAMGGCARYSLTRW